MLARFPDAVPSDVNTLLLERAAVVPVPLDESCYTTTPNRSETKPLHIVWNHRWEYDKGPERLLETVAGLLERHVEFSLSVLGEQFRQRPPAFSDLHKLLELTSRCPSALGLHRIRG